METHVEMAVVQVVVAHVRMHVPVHVLERARHSAQVRVNTDVMEVVHPNALDLVLDAVEIAKTLAKAAVLEIPETHQIPVDVGPYAHQHADFLAKMTAPVVVVVIVATCVRPPVPIHVLEIVLVLHLGVAL